MTLKEKFKRFAYFNLESNSIQRERQREDNAIRCEQIADDYAVEFAEWLICMKDFKTGIYLIKTSKELLEIFKKEKKL